MHHTAHALLRLDTIDAGGMRTGGRGIPRLWKGVFRQSRPRNTPFQSRSVQNQGEDPDLACHPPREQSATSRNRPTPARRGKR